MTPITLLELAEQTLIHSSVENRIPVGPTFVFVSRENIWDFEIFDSGCCFGCSLWLEKFEEVVK